MVGRAVGKFWNIEESRTPFWFLLEIYRARRVPLPTGDAIVFARMALHFQYVPLSTVRATLTPNLHPRPSSPHAPTRGRPRSVEELTRELMSRVQTLPTGWQLLVRMQCWNGIRNIGFDNRFGVSASRCQVRCGSFHLCTCHIKNPAALSRAAVLAARAA